MVNKKRRNPKARPAERSREKHVRVPVNSDADILLVRQRGRELAAEAHLTGLEATFLAKVISKLACTILQYAGRGKIFIRNIQQENRTGVIVVARDHGPGISNAEGALRDVFSTPGGLGLGFSGA